MNLAEDRHGIAGILNALANWTPEISLSRPLMTAAAHVGAIRQSQFR
jgi:hypothetical protein